MVHGLPVDTLCGTVRVRVIVPPFFELERCAQYNEDDLAATSGSTLRFCCLLLLFVVG